MALHPGRREHQPSRVSNVNNRKNQTVFRWTPWAGCQAALLLAALSLPFGAQAETCNGLEATLIGTAGDDIIAGGNGDDVIVGLDGNDTITGGNGTDTICGGDGNDSLDGGNGADYLDGGQGADSLAGGRGPDRLNGWLGDDALNGGQGPDDCDGDIGNDSTTACEVAINMALDIGQVVLASPDGRSLEGALFVPEQGPNSKVAVLTTHGATGTFRSAIALDAGFFFEPYGMTVLSLNRRDNGFTEGGGNTLFPDATCDLKVGVDYLTGLGYDQVFVMGHSKGTTMASIYPSWYPNCPGATPTATQDPRIAGVGTYGTIASNIEAAQFALFPEPLYTSNLNAANFQVGLGLGNVPYPFPTVFGFPLVRTPNSWLSFHGPATLGVPEREVAKLEVPLLVVHAAGDNFTPAPWSVRVVNAALAAGVDATLVNLPYPLPNPPPGGPAHSFTGIQRETIGATWAWLATHVPAVLEPATGVTVPALPPFVPALQPNP